MKKVKPEWQKFYLHLLELREQLVRQIIPWLIAVVGGFVFVGLMFSAFFQFWLNVFAENIRQEQYWGTMERIFLCPRGPLSIITSSVSAKAVILLFEIAAMLLIGKIMFGPGLAGLFKIIIIFNIIW